MGFFKSLSRAFKKYVKKKREEARKRIELKEKRRKHRRKRT